MQEFVYSLPETSGIIRKRRDYVGVILFFRCENQIMVAVTKRFESRPIKSRVGAFPDVFGMTRER